MLVKASTCVKVKGLVGSGAAICLPGPGHPTNKTHTHTHMTCCCLPLPGTACQLSLKARLT